MGNQNIRKNIMPEWVSSGEVTKEEKIAWLEKYLLFQIRFCADMPESIYLVQDDYDGAYALLVDYSGNEPIRFPVLFVDAVKVVRAKRNGHQHKPRVASHPGQPFVVEQEDKASFILNELYATLAAAEDMDDADEVMRREYCTIDAIFDDATRDMDKVDGIVPDRDFDTALRLCREGFYDEKTPEAEGTADDEAATPPIEYFFGCDDDPTPDSEPTDPKQEQDGAEEV